MRGEDTDCDGDPDTHGGGPCISCSHRVPGDFDSITSAVDAASDGDAICVEPGSYPEAGINFGGKGLQLVGLAGPGATTIDGEQGGTVLLIDDGEGGDTVVEGFTVRGGYSDRGGGIRVEAASPTLRNLVVTDNHAYQSAEDTGIGGGILLDQSSASLARIVASSNVADDDGGGIWIRDSTLALEDVDASANTAGLYGGGIYSEDSDLTMLAVRLADNEAGIHGGGMWLGGGVSTFTRGEVTGNATDSCEECQGGGLSLSWANAAVQGVTVSRNSSHEGGGIAVSGVASLRDVAITHHDAVSRGGGLYLHDGTALLDRLRVAGNLGGNGGGIYAEIAELELTGGVIAGNTATDSGGGLQLVDTTAVITSATLVANVAQDRGGGIYLASPTLSAQNITVSHNLATEWGGIYLLAGPDPELRYCNVGGNTGGDLAHFASDPTGSSGNLSLVPEFLDIGADDPEEWDVHLIAGGALVDGGNPTWLDPDGSPSDIGAHGAESAGLWDLDLDGYPLWWQPGDYDHGAYPAQGWDCDDADETVYPDHGC